MNTMERPGSALSDEASVRAFADRLADLADALHGALRRLTDTAGTEANIAYALLTEEYALRARANILSNDASRHVTTGLTFTQDELLTALQEMRTTLAESKNLLFLSSTVTDVITFSSAVAPGKARELNFLAKNLGIAVVDSP